MPDPIPCPFRYASTEGTTAGAVVACRQTGRHTIHSNLADLTPDRVTWISGDGGELIRLGCDWCRKPGATHTADEHPLPAGHPDYDAFYDATDTDLADMTSATLDGSWGTWGKQR